MSYKETIEAEINRITNEKLVRNDATTYGSNLFSACRQLVSETFTATNASKSYDEKIDILVEGLKSLLQVQEQSLLDLISEIKTLDDQKIVLENIVTQNASNEESKKKGPEPLSPEQEEAVQE